MSQECTNKRVMIIREGVIVTKQEKDNEKEESNSSMENVGVIEDISQLYLVERKALHTRKLVQNVPCSIIIDHENCINVVNTYFTQLI